MRKSDLIQEIARKTDIKIEESKEAVEKFFDSIMITLAEGKRVEIRGFGAFTVRKYGSYKGRNPKTGEPITVEEKLSPFFKSGAPLRKRVDGEQLWD